jgi:hypothetical protein
MLVRVLETAIYEGPKTQAISTYVAWQLHNRPYGKNKIEPFKQSKTTKRITFTPRRIIEF